MLQLLLTCPYFLGFMAFALVLLLYRFFLPYCFCCVCLMFCFCVFILFVLFYLSLCWLCKMHLTMLSLHLNMYPFFFYRGSTATLGQGLVSRIRDDKHTTLDRTPLDEWSAWRRYLYLTTHNTQTGIHAPGRIRTHNPNRRAAADPHLIPRGHWVQ